MIVAGKSRIVYLLDGAALGGIGQEESSLPDACNDDIDGGVAVEGTTVFLPCLSGTIAIRASSAPARLRVLWRSSVGGGPPIVAGGLVWTIGQDGTLFGLDPSTGALREHAVVGAPANHFPTPSVGAGRLLAASADHVIAFTMSSTLDHFDRDVCVVQHDDHGRPIHHHVECAGRWWGFGLTRRLGRGRGCDRHRRRGHHLDSASAPGNAVRRVRGALRILLSAEAMGPNPRVSE